MRPVLIGDLIACARVLLAQPEAQWTEIIARMIRQAKQAETYRIRYRRAHVKWGDGSLMSLAATCPMVREPFLDDTRYLRALRCIIEGLLQEKLSFVSGKVGLYNGVRNDGADSNG